ncbi:hypothetical protein ASE90_18520 [Sphingomonas sp. Leaf67]|uniref:hypothetical protein n=1 Tax=Sphingomonas sp. Leaf67 TaxID=1736230 RepID=UPI0006F4C899|nr:hypothetical protein [Sphingomonas sp. Leaf67]KQN88870.1 hypothetical protein ASE90_18520 [Sphingomonas sp. Leaf67]
MDSFSKEVARNLYQLLATEISANARIAAALGLDSVALQLNLALESVFNAFAERYEHTLSPDDDQ